MKSCMVLAGIFLLLFLACSENIVDNPIPNQPPDTYLFIRSSDTLNQTPSVQTLYWDGRDSDGFVVGFYYSWQENPAPADWQFTTERSLTFPLKIAGSDTNYMFNVKAVDDDGAEDPEPARQLIPIKNSPPVMNWTRISNIPDTTFTVASFVWEVSDLDGDSTINYFEYALDDTSAWKKIPGFSRGIVLNADSGLTVGDHEFFVRAVDIAGTRSNLLRMPDNPSKFWHVKAPAGRYLLIDDFGDENSSGFPDAYFQGMLQNVVVPLGEGFSYWNIEDLFPASVQQFTETLKLFDVVIWYTDVSKETDEHFLAAQLSLPVFRASGGKIIYTTMFDNNFGAQGDPLAFAPVDSLFPQSGTYRSLINHVYQPDSAFYSIFPALQLPVLKVSRFIPAMKALTPKGNAIPLYRSNAIGPPPASGLPIFMVLGKNDNTGEYDFLFSGAPLHQLQGGNNLDQFFDVILNQVFN